MSDPHTSAAAENPALLNPATGAHTSPSLGSSLRSLSGKWGWIVALGALFIIAGTIALITVLPATVVSVLWVGAMMLVAGIGEVIAAFQFKDWGRFTLWLLLGAMYVAAGILTFMNPLLAAASLTLLLSIALIVGGIIRMWLAFNMKESQSWGWVMVSGVITLGLGIMILMRWPASSLYTLGIFLGVDMLFAGFGWVAAGLAIRRLTDGKFNGKTVDATATRT